MKKGLTFVKDLGNRWVAQRVGFVLANVNDVPGEYNSPPFFLSILFTVLQ